MVWCICALTYPLCLDSLESHHPCFEAKQSLLPKPLAATSPVWARERLMRRFHHLQSYVGALECSWRRSSSSNSQPEVRRSHPVPDDAVWHFFESCWFTDQAAPPRSTKTSSPPPIPASKYSTTSLNLNDNLLNHFWFKKKLGNTQLRRRSRKSSHAEVT